MGDIEKTSGWSSYREKVSKWTFTPMGVSEDCCIGEDETLTSNKVEPGKRSGGKLARSKDIPRDNF